MKKKLQLLRKSAGLLLLLAAPALHAQWQEGLWIGKQANNWCDTSQGIKFTTGAPVTFTGVQLNALEGSTTISAENGDLLFYAGQKKIWNKNNQIMVNGNNLTGGDDSSTQSGVFVQKPGSTNIYYLFNVNEASTVAGLLYSEIDLTLDNGLGAVTANKNIMLDALVGVEKITAVHNADGSGVWVISHRTGSAEFVAFLVTSAGVSTTPVVSSVGTLYSAVGGADPYASGNNGGAGQLKASPDGTKLAAAILNSENRGVDLLDFDASTGIVSNAKHIPDSEGFVYGLEFSPNSRFLYVSNPQGGYVFGGSINQYDVTLATEADIIASQNTVVTFPSGSALGPCGMQLASNGRIYIKDVVGEVINAIDTPNNAGTAAGFNDAAINMSSSIGTPAFIQSYFESGILSGEGCPGVVAFSLLRIPDATSIAWDFGDPNSGAANTSAIAQHAFSAAGTYTVTAVITSNGSTQTATTTITVGSPNGPITVPGNLTQCGTGSVVFNLTTQTPVILGSLDAAVYTVTYYTTEADALANTNAITTPVTFTSAGQTIYAAVVNSGNTCISYTSFDLIINALPVLPQLPNLQTCDTAAADGFAAFDLTSQDAALTQGLTGATVTYFTDSTFTSAIVTPASFTNTVNPQTIYAVVNTATGCANSATFTIEVTPAIQLPVVPNLSLCDSGTPDGFTNFDLTTQDAALLQGLPAGTVAYYTSQADAQGGVNAIAAPNSFVNTQNPQTIYAVVTNTTTGCTGTASFLLQATPVPTAPLVSGLESCDTGIQDGIANFDLTVHTDALLQGQPGYTVAYFTALADAEANTNAIATPATFSNSVNPQNIYARISNGTCYAVAGFDVTVLPTPQIGGALQIVGCPPFNLPAVVSGNGLNFTYYSTEADATAQTNAIASPAAYVNTNGLTTVYVRGESAEGCEAFAEITLDTGDCNIPKGISPNNDGMNDAFDISFLDVQKLSVFNRYGMEVYALSNYTNQWYGQQDNGKELPTGTYYYVIEFAAGNSKTGWVYINRQVN